MSAKLNLLVVFCFGVIWKRKEMIHSREDSIGEDGYYKNMLSTPFYAFYALLYT